MNAGAEEFVQHVVLVGGDDEAAQRHAHLAGDMGGADALPKLPRTTTLTFAEASCSMTRNHVAT